MAVYDILGGGEGNDGFTWRDGNDRLFGWSGDDSLNGEVGNEYGEDGSDRLYGYWVTITYAWRVYPVIWRGW